MIQINLLPGAKKKKAARTAPSVDFSAAMAGLSGKFKDRLLVAAVASAIIGTAAIGWMYFSQAGAREDLEARLDKAITDSSRFATLLRSRQSAMVKRDTLERQVNLIRTLDEDRYIWPHVLDEVSRALPQYTWLTSLTFTGTPQGAVNVAASPPPPKDTAKADTSAAAKKMKEPPRLATDIPRDPVTIRVMGRTVDIQAMTRFYRQLEASPYLANVALEKSEFANEAGKEVTQFTFTMSYTRPDTSMIRRRPLVVER
jgi:Tfp pilus assembly protein PilN